jgi:hypothetical protein
MTGLTHIVYEVLAGQAQVMCEALVWSRTWSMGHTCDWVRDLL